MDQFLQVEILFLSVTGENIFSMNTYLLLAEFSGRTVNYGPSFFPSIYGPSAKRAGDKSIEQNEDP